MFSVTSFTKEGGEGVVGNFLFLRNSTIRLNSMFQTILLHSVVRRQVQCVCSSSTILTSSQQALPIWIPAYSFEWITTLFLMRSRGKGRVGSKLFYLTNVNTNNLSHFCTLNESRKNKIKKKKEQNRQSDRIKVLKGEQGEGGVRETFFFF